MHVLKTIFFDATGTLIHVPRGVGFHYAEVAARHGWDVDGAAVGRAFRSVWSELPPPVITRKPAPDDGRAWWSEVVRQVLDRCGAPPSFDRERYFQEVYARFSEPGVWAVYPEVVEVLEALAPRFRLCVLSNFDRRLRTILAELDLLHRFTDVIVSSEAGAAKPDPWIFSHALAQTRTTAHEALLVGDDPDCDIAGARQAGWQAFYLDRTRMTLQDFLAALSAG